MPAHYHWFSLICPQSHFWSIFMYEHLSPVGPTSPRLCSPIESTVEGKGGGEFLKSSLARFKRAVNGKRWSPHRRPCPTLGAAVRGSSAPWTPWDPGLRKSQCPDAVAAAAPVAVAVVSVAAPAVGCGRSAACWRRCWDAWVANPPDTGTSADDWPVLRWRWMKRCCYKQRMRVGRRRQRRTESRGGFSRLVGRRGGRMSHDQSPHSLVSTGNSTAYRIVKRI